MTYDQALSFTHSLLRFGIRPGLERINALLEKLGDPQDSLQVVHVAGTNGKGSTCAMLSSIFRAAGMRTGLFISPYVVDFRERIQIDGEMISKEDFARLVERMMPVMQLAMQEGESPTEFEFITAAAFLYFQEKGCNIVVLETGLGGRYDSTNVVKQPLASVITSISMDHMDILGHDIGSITLEKAGIIKDHGLCITSPDQEERALGVLIEQACARHAMLFIPSRDHLTIDQEGLAGTQMTYQGVQYFIPLCGRHQVSNALTVLETVRRLRDRGLPVSEKAMCEGLAAVHIPARMELISRTPLVLLDGMHNPGGAHALRAVLEAYLKDQPMTALVGMMRDKNYQEVLEILLPLFDAVVTVTPDNPRALPAQELAEAAKPYCAQVCTHALDAKLAEFALQQAAGRPLIVFGSFYLAASIRPKLLECTQNRQEN